MELSTSAQKRDKFLQNVLSGALFGIFCLVGMAMIASGNDSGAWGVGLAAAVGSACIAYVAKLGVSARVSDGD